MPLGKTSGGDSPLVVKVAGSAELVEALRLRAAIYSEELGFHGVDFADRTALHIVALRDEELVGALRLIGPSPLPLEIEQYTRPEAATSRTMQIGGFWIGKNYRRVTGSNIGLFNAFGTAISRCARRLGVCSILLRTHIPEVEPLYRAAGFRRVPTLDFVHPMWGPVYAMRLQVVSEEAPQGLEASANARQGSSRLKKGSGGDRP